MRQPRAGGLKERLEAEGGSIATEKGVSARRSLSPDSDQIADIAGGRLRANMRLCALGGCSFL
jgi:hypothetical protein